MPLTLGTRSFVLAVGSLIVALTKRADTGEWRWLLGSAALILGTLHFVVPLPKITQTVLSIGAILVFTLLIFALLSGAASLIGRAALSRWTLPRDGTSR